MYRLGEQFPNGSFMHYMEVKQEMQHCGSLTCHVNKEPVFDLKTLSLRFCDVPLRPMDKEAFSVCWQNEPKSTTIQYLPNWLSYE